MALTQKSLRVAAGQMPALILDRAEEAWPIIERLAEEAAHQHVELLVLPECAYPAYYLESPARAGSLPRDSLSLERLASLSKQFSLHLVCGFVESCDNRLFNSAAVLDPGGRLIGIARKNFLWDCDNRWFTPGDDIRVFDTALGRIGVLICADARAPEIPATLAAKHADFIAMPTAWVNVSGRSDARYNIQPDFLIQARALEFGLPYICADKAGDEPPLQYVGQSLIVSGDGRELARGPLDGEALVIADLSPGYAKPSDITDAQRLRLMQPPVNFDATTSQTVTLTCRPSNFATGPARAARLDGDSLGMFAAARCLALDGVQVICADDVDVPLPLLRARAAENRIFVMASGTAGTFIIGPDGRFIASGRDIALSIEVDLNEANVKRFTADTDLWAQRRQLCPPSTCHGLRKNADSEVDP